MVRDREAFRERFKAYKNGKSVREIYGLPEYGTGKEPYDGYEDFIDSVIKEEGFIPHPRDIGDGKMTLGSGLTKKKWRDLYESRGKVWSLADNRRAVKEELAETELYLRTIFPDYDSYPQAMKEVLLDILYNTGKVNMKYSPKFVTAVRNKNWFRAAREMDWGNTDPVFGKGLRSRNERRRQKWYSALNVNTDPIIEQPDVIRQAPSISVPRTIPQEQTTPTYDPNISPYISGAPMLKHTFEYHKTIDLPTISQMLESSKIEEPLFKYLYGKPQGEIRLGTKGSRLDKFSRAMDPDADDGTTTRVIKRIGKGVANLVNDVKTVSGLRTAEKFATNTQNPTDYIDAAFLTVGNAMISKMMQASSKTLARLFIKSFGDMDAMALGKYFFEEHPELITKPKEAWYGELAKKSDAYFRLAIHRRAKLFDKEGRPLDPESIAAQISPDIKTALIKGSRYGGIYSPSNNTMLINSDLVKDPRTAARVYNHERAHSMQTAFENEIGLPYPVNYGVLMENLFRYTPEYKTAHPGVRLGLETDASLHEGKSLAAYDKNLLGNALDVDFANMTDEEFYLYMNNGYFNNLRKSIPVGAKEQKKFIKNFKYGKIAIKPSKRGTFTAAAKKHGASVKEFEKRVLKNPEKYSKAIVKKALFSRNARSWKH